MGEGEGKEEVLSSSTSSYRVRYNRKDALTEIMENWRRRSKLGWDKRKGKDHEFNFGLESEALT